MLLMPKLALVVIDVQEGILTGITRRPDENEKAYDEVVWRIADLLKRARAANVPVIYVQHEGGVGHRLEPGSAGFPIREEIAPKRGEIVVLKRFCDSFCATNLQSELEKISAETLVVVGCMTQYCVDTSVRRAVSSGFDVILVKDAHMTADSGSLTFEQIIAHHNRTLHGLDANAHVVTVKPAAEIVFEESAKSSGA